MSNSPDQSTGLEIEQRNFNVKRFLFGYIKYWYLFLISLIVALLIARYYNWYATPIYRSSCRIILEDQNAGGEDILKELNDYKRNRNIENEIQILKSVSLISKAVKQLDLEETYILQGKIKSTELYTKCPFSIKSDTLYELAYFSELDIKVLNHEKFELSFHPINKEDQVITKEYSFNKLIANDLGVYSVNFRKEFDANLFDNPKYDKRNYKVFFNPVENIASYYAANLAIEVAASGSSILQLSATDVVPEQCADFLNKLSEVYVQNSIEQKNLLASNSIKFIDVQIKQISEELKQIEDNMLAYKSSKGIIDVDAESKLFLEQVKGFDEKISENNVQLSFIDYLEKYIKDNKKVNDITPSSLGIADPLLIKLISSLSELENERDRRNYDSKQNSPVIESLDQQIKKVKGAILETLSGIRQNYMLMQKEASQQLGKIEGKIRNMPKTEIELISIKRQFTIKEGLYVYLLQKRSETAILLASTVSDNRIIDKAEPSYSPIKPVKSKTNAIAIVLGLLLPALGISLRNLLNDKVADRDVLESNTKIPLMGIVGLHEGNYSLFSEQKPKAIFLESLRTIRTNINYFIGENKSKKKQNIILVTSSISGEGKTFCAYNLSGIFAMSEKKTVLVCLDMRKPKLVDGIKPKHEKGMSNYLAGISTVEEVTQKADALPFLDIIFWRLFPQTHLNYCTKRK